MGLMFDIRAEYAAYRYECLWDMGNKEKVEGEDLSNGEIDVPVGDTDGFLATGVVEGSPFQPFDLRLQFEAHADYDDELSVYARPREIAPVKFGYDYLVRDDERETLLVYGYTIHCCINKARKVIPVDPVTKAIFDDFGVRRRI